MENDRRSAVGKLLRIYWIFRSTDPTAHTPSPGLTIIHTRKIGVMKMPMGTADGLPTLFSNAFRIMTACRNIRIYFLRLINMFDSDAI